MYQNKQLREEKTLFEGVHVVTNDTCAFKKVCYLDIIDLANYSENNIFLEELCSNRIEKHPCPKSILNGIVGILR